MKQYLPFVLVFAVACSGDDEASPNDGAACFANSDCNGACFLGRCTDVGAGISNVSIDVQPPRVSGALRQRVQRTVDAEAGPQAIQLAASARITGSVVRDSRPVSGDIRAQLVTAPLCQPTTVDESTTYTGSVDNRGIDLNVIAGAYRITFIPNDDDLPPLTYPTDGTCGVALRDGMALALAYPEVSTRVSGRLRYSTSDTTGVAGAQVVARTVDNAGTQHTSNVVGTGSDGSFAVDLPAAGTSYSLDVRAGTNLNVPTVSFPNLVRDSGGAVGDLTLDVSAPIPLQVSVVNASGEAINDATVTAVGTVGGGTLTVSGATSAGAVTLSLRAGTFTIVAAPRRSLSAGLVGTTVTLVDSAIPAPVALVAPPKAAVAGVVRTFDGSVLANARVTFHLTNTTTGTPDRDASATTDENGAYSLSVDAVDFRGLPAEHEVTVDPPSGSRDPRLRQLVRIDASEVTHDITLLSATFLYGTVLDADGSPIPQTALLFYSNDLGGTAPLLVGVAQSDAIGEFAVPLPQPDAGE